MKISGITFIIVAAWFNSDAQFQFEAQSNIIGVEQDGFYRIALTPALSPLINNEVGNIRIYDSNGKEVPYLFEEEKPVYQTKKFRQYTILESKRTANCCTSIVLQNPERNSINNISLLIKNAEVTKEATLLGSDDKENWFALKQKFTINSISSQRETSEIKIVDFPLSNYDYYRIDLDDSSTAALNILTAGYYEVISEEGKYSEIPVKVTRSDSSKLKETYLRLSFDSLRKVDKITLKMNGAPYFLRQAMIYERIEKESRNGRRRRFNKVLSSFVLSSKQITVVELDAKVTEELFILIENKDNQPLDVLDLRVYQLNRYITAWLKNGESYTLKFGSQDLKAAVYDIGYFKENIPGNVPILYTTDVKLTNNDQRSESLFTSNVVIWIAIAFVIGVLGFMAVKMVGETNKASGND